MTTTNVELGEYYMTGPQSTVERQLIETYLREQGYRREDLRRLPEAEAKRLMRAACMYASLRLAEVEAGRRFREKIGAPS